ncbi:MAG: MarR family transcriptional regulator [Chloroflexota bacterium]
MSISLQTALTACKSTQAWYPDTAMTEQQIVPTPQIDALRETMSELSDSDLDLLTRALSAPTAITSYPAIEYSRIHLLVALAFHAPIRLNALARHLHRNRSNTFHSLQRLVSLGLVARYKKNGKVYYTLASNLPSTNDMDFNQEE